jgi:hypothetical protein
VLVVEGTVGEPIPQSESLARYNVALAGEDRMHPVGMQLGENIAKETSAPQSVNRGDMLRVEKAIRATADMAAEHGASVETRTEARITFRPGPAGEEVPACSGIRRQAWLRPAGTDVTTEPFVDLKIDIDPVTREVSYSEPPMIKTPVGYKETPLPEPTPRSEPSVAAAGTAAKNAGFARTAQRALAPLQPAMLILQATQNSPHVHNYSEADAETDYFGRLILSWFRLCDRPPLPPHLGGDSELWDQYLRSH